VLEKMAEVYGRGVSFFLSEEKPVFTLLLRADQVGHEERKVLGRFEQFCRDYAEMEKYAEGAPSLAPSYDAPSSFQARTAKGRERYAIALAEAERKRLGLGDEPIKDIFLLLEQQGAHPVRVALGEESQLAGAFIFSPSVGAFTLINASHRRERQVFTAAHEYCHYLKDRAEGLTLDPADQATELPDGERPPKEVIANIFAANFLMPASALARVLSNTDHIGAEEVIYLRRYFGVSQQAMVYRLMSLGWVKRERGAELLEVRPDELERRFVRSVPEEVETDSKVPSQFFKLAMHAYMKEHISLGRLAELLGSTPPELRRLLAQSRILAGEGEGGGKAPH
jgi:Zn-dependent peptidase ImmA (M78 family)